MMNTVFGNTLLDQYNGSIIKRDINESLTGKKVIGLYFSAHYCKYCREFTPTLINFYNEVIKTKPDFEIIFIASDKSEDEFLNYYTNMPWLSLPYERRDVKEILVEKFSFKTIPQLIFVDDNFNIITKQGRKAVADNVGFSEIIYEHLKMQTNK